MRMQLQMVVGGSDNTGAVVDRADYVVVDDEWEEGAQKWMVGKNWGGLTSSSTPLHLLEDKSRLITAHNPTFLLRSRIFFCVNVGCANINFPASMMGIQDIECRGVLHKLEDITVK